MPKGRPTAGTRSWSAHHYLARVQVGKTAEGTPKYKYKYTSSGAGQAKVASAIKGQKK